jgi:chemotaxis signal transduction protein
MNVGVLDFEAIKIALFVDSCQEIRITEPSKIKSSPPFKNKASPQSVKDVLDS